MCKRPIVLGLTGSIAMGKSVAAHTFRQFGVPIFDADAEVHRLLAQGGAAVAPIARLWPEVCANDTVDRGALGRRVFGDAEALKTLEAILHPMVGRGRTLFLRRAAARRVPIVVLDVPLLFETGGDRNCDYTAVVSAPPRVQWTRALRRPGMTRAKLSSILERQMPDRVKRRRADFVILTGLSKRYSRTAVGHILRTLSDPRACGSTCRRLTRKGQSRA